MSQSKPRFFRRFFRELLLQSGQFALFYLVLQFNNNGWNFFTNMGHTALLAILVLQTSVLVLWGERPVVRFVGSLIAPLCYSLIEAREGTLFLFNAAHAGFWAFSLLTGALQTLSLVTRRLTIKMTWEFLLTITNVTVFVFLYFYFDTLHSVKSQAELALDRIGTHIPEFLADPTHHFILWGGALLAFSLALGRTDVLRLKERLNALFGKYVDKDIRDEIVAGQGSQARQVDLAVLFSDLRNFTACSENASPQAVTQMLNLYFSRWTELVHRHDGVVDKFIGDAVMVLFGLRGDVQACDAAVACGREMLAQWPGLREELAQKGLPVPEGLGIGLHFGSVVLGDIGSEERKNFTAIGDTVNTASRLESASKQVGQPFLLTGAVRARLSPEFVELCRPQGRITFKGKQQSAEVWSIDAEGRGPAR